jgi:post-segregation antitoxin (ccd killing protein)
VTEKKAREEKWLEENRAAMDAYNERIERDGLTFAAFLNR